MNEIHLRLLTHERVIIKLLLSTCAMILFVIAVLLLMMTNGKLIMSTNFVNMYNIVSFRFQFIFLVILKATPLLIWCLGHGFGNDFLKFTFTTNFFFLELIIFALKNHHHVNIIRIFKNEGARRLGKFDLI